MQCELCELVKLDKIVTELYYQSRLCVIVDCLSCGTPMLVFYKHGLASEEEREKAMAVVNELFEYEYIRTEGRKIKNHEHWHIGGNLR